MTVSNILYKRISLAADSISSVPEGVYFVESISMGNESIPFATLLILPFSIVWAMFSSVLHRTPIIKSIDESRAIAVVERDIRNIDKVGLLPMFATP